MNRRVSIEKLNDEEKGECSPRNLSVLKGKNEFHAYAKRLQRTQSISLSLSAKKGDVDTHRHEWNWHKSTRNSVTLEDSGDIALIVKELGSNYLFFSLDDKAIVDIARQFELVEYEPGSTIIEQGESIAASVHECGDYYYILADGECVVLKDGKLVHGKHGIIQAGTSFGENTMLYDRSVRTATIIASEPSPRTGTIAVYRLKQSIYRKAVGSDEVTNLKNHIKEIQSVVDILSGVNTKVKKGTIIRPYKPSSLWLGKQWRGTVLQFVGREVAVMVVSTALLGIFVNVVIRNYAPGYEEAILGQLELVGGWWSTLSPLTTFVTTFFLAESYQFWKRFYDTTRCVQGRLHDINLISASTAARSKNGGQLTEGAAAALDDIARITRLQHLFFWCTLMKRFKCLLSPEGISYLLSKRLITQDEYASLIEVGTGGFSPDDACLTWLLSRIVLAVERGDLGVDQAAMICVYDKITALRAHYATLSDLYDGRMPLAYVHFVNLLVGALIVVSPVALFPLYSWWSIAAVGLITLFYDGIFKLSLMFLDPVDNDKKHQLGSDQTPGFDVGVLLRESNTGSIRYKGCTQVIPEY